MLRRWAEDPQLDLKRAARSALYPGEIDLGNSICTKSSSKYSFAGGTKGNGKSLSPLVMADHPISMEELDSAPVGTALDQQGKPVPPAFNINKSGGMEKEDMLIWLKKIAIPSTAVTPTARHPGARRPRPASLLRGVQGVDQRRPRHRAADPARLVT